MAILELLIITDYTCSRRIIGFLPVLTLDQTQPDPNRPDLWMDPTHVQLWSKPFCHD